MGRKILYQKPVIQLALCRKEERKRNYIPEVWRRARTKFSVWLLNNFLRHSSSFHTPFTARKVYHNFNMTA